MAIPATFFAIKSSRLRNRKCFLKKFVATLLSLCIGLFLADAVLSLLDDSLIQFWNLRLLTGVRGVVLPFSFLATVLTYLMMGITPMIPKRFFLPMTLFGPAVLLGTIPLSIYRFDQLPQISWLVSLCQVLVGVGLLAWLQGGFKFRWPMVPEGRVGNKAFGWMNLCGFVLIHLLVVVPACLVYFAWCSSLALDHFSAGFLALRSDSLTVRAKEYVRNDGKTIYLIPMMHIGEAGFYQQIMKSFPTNSTILLEGVTDRKNLLKHPISYKRVASSLGLSEQKQQFEPTQGRPRPADVDVEQFSAKSIEFLNLATLVHSQGFTAEVILQLIQKSQDSQMTKHLLEDLLTLRNEHLLKEIQEELLRSDKIVVPWGAAHMQGLSEGIQKAGFNEASSREYNVLQYSTILNSLKSR